MARLASYDSYSEKLEDQIEEFTAERALLDDLAAYARETRGFIEDAQIGSGFHARQLRALLLRHKALVAAR